jgi:hypothetical protein
MAWAVGLYMTATTAACPDGRDSSIARQFGFASEEQRCTMEPGWPAELIAASDSIRIKPWSSVNGGVIGTRALVGAAPTYVVQLGSRVLVRGRVSADVLEVATSATVLDATTFNRRVGTGRIPGSIATPRGRCESHLPLIPSFEPSNEAITVASGARRALAAGAYGVVRLEEGRPGRPTMLRLGGGRYAFSALLAGAWTRIECHYACTLLVEQRFEQQHSSYFGPAPNTALGPADVTLLVAAPPRAKSSSSAGVRFGASADIAARVFASERTLDIGPQSMVYGSLIGQHVVVGESSSIEPMACLPVELVASMGVRRHVVLEHSSSFVVPGRLQLSSDASPGSRALLKHRPRVGSEIACRYVSDGNAPQVARFDACSDGRTAGDIVQAEWVALELEAPASPRVVANVALERCAGGYGLPYPIAMPHRTKIEYSADHPITVAVRHLLVAWKPGSAWRDIRGAVHSAGAHITGIWPDRGISAVDFDDPLQFDAEGQMIGGFAVRLPRSDTRVQRLQHDPLVDGVSFDPVAQYYLWGMNSSTLYQREDEAKQHARFELRPERPLEGDLIMLRLLHNPLCFVRPYILPKRANDALTRIVVMDEDTKDACSLPIDIDCTALNCSSADARRGDVRIGILPAGRYALEVGAHTVLFDVLPADTDPGPLPLEARLRFEVARVGMPQPCENDDYDENAQLRYRQLRLRYPDLADSRVAYLMASASRVRIHQRTPFSFSYEYAVGCDGSAYTGTIHVTRTGPDVGIAVSKPVLDPRSP